MGLSTLVGRCDLAGGVYGERIFLRATSACRRFFACSIVLSMISCVILGWYSIEGFDRETQVRTALQNAAHWTIISFLAGNVHARAAGYCNEDTLTGLQMQASDGGVWIL